MKKSSLPKDNDLSDLPAESPNNLSDLPAESPKHSNFPFIVLLIIILLIGFGAVIYFFGTSLFGTTESQVTKAPSTITQAPPSPTPSPTPTPRPIPHGKIPFRVSGGAGPQLATGYIDPYDPAQKTVQIFHVSASDNVPVTSFKGKLKTDHGIQNLVFSLVGGTATNGEWEARWTVMDTYLYTYELDLIVTSIKGITKPEIMLR